MKITFEELKELAGELPALQFYRRYLARTAPLEREKRLFKLMKSLQPKCPECNK